MNRILLVSMTALLAACAGQKQQPEVKEQEFDDVAKIKKLVANEPKPVVTETREQANKIVVTGSRIMREEAASADMAYYHPLPQTLNTSTLPPQDRENYQHFENQTVQSVFSNPISTFSIDVDTGSYANVRRMLNQGMIPRQDAVRVEELINYFSYDYQSPENLSQPFLANTEIAPSPWNPEAHLLHIGIKGFDKQALDRPAANLVFLVDVSGSMNSPDKLGLLKSSLKLLTKQMTSEDKVSIVVYAGAAGVVLEPTAGNNQAKIASALEQLSAGGSTNGAAGIHLAYQMAEQNLVKDGINRILIATDGDFNVGTTNFEALKELVEEKRKKGVSLTTLGFGTGNYNDHLMEQLADVGNGNYAYIDTIKEANKVLVDQINSTLFTIAKDVKIQIEFNPEVVTEYRLIGYENRHLNNEDFDNDKVDAGEIGAGHTVTAIYEIVMNGNKGWLSESRYQKNVVSKNISDEIAFLKIRYKQPDAETSQLLQWPIKKNQIKDLDEASNEYKFAAAVAAFGQLLRDGTYLKSFAYDDVLTLARNSKGKDPFGYRGEFIQLVSLAKGLAK
ncbi:MAG: VWA domain-containing protein [Xanthomonadales bacterium]|nr:VWA domain-containing protein [Xanthomonadales bacterium]